MKIRKKKRVNVDNIETDNQIVAYRCQQIKFTNKERKKERQKQIRKKEKKGKSIEHRDR